MAKPEPTVKSDLDAKINEAEVCLSMGLYDEALSIFNQVIDEYPDLEEDRKKNITEKIDSIKKELADQEVSEAGSVSTEEISKLHRRRPRQYQVLRRGLFFP